MIDTREIRAKKNILTSLIGQVVSLICGLVIPRLMIETFGSEAYGATSSITQFLAYITLLEGGVGGVARAVLYKPLAEKDGQKISAIMSEIRRFFRVVAIIFAVYVLVIAVSYPAISQITCMDWISTFVLVVVISISTLGQYFIGISHSILLQAAQQTYITNLVSIGATILNVICIVMLIACGCNLIVVKLVSSVVFLMRPMLLSFYVKKTYPLSEKETGKKTTYLTQKWSGLGQHLAFFLHSNTDIAILTLLSNLRVVAVYSVYNMIISNIQNLTASFTSGMEAVFGDMLARNEKHQLHSVFQMYETILSIVSIILFSVAATLAVPFVELYTLGIADADYIQPVFSLLLVLCALSYCLRQPYHSIIIAAGHFKQTGVAAYGEASINIILSLFLVSEYNLLGVVIATLVATWFRFIYYVYYLSKNIFCRKIASFVKRFIINGSAFICNCIIGHSVVANFPIDNFLSWIICGALLVLAVSINTLVINVLFFKDDCIFLIKKTVEK